MTDRDLRRECTCGPVGDYREEGPQQPDEDCPQHGNQDDSYAPDPRDERCGGCGEPKNNGQAHGYWGELGGCI